MFIHIQCVLLKSVWCGEGEGDKVPVKIVKMFKCSCKMIKRPTSPALYNDIFYSQMIKSCPLFFQYFEVLITYNIESNI